MTIIDLLNRIANGEELPKKIKYDDKIYYMVGNNDYENYEYDEEPTLMYAIGNTHNMNDEVEIIEEGKKIEKIEKIDLIDDYTPYIQFRVTANKINEIIDYLNKEE